MKFNAFFAGFLLMFLVPGPVSAQDAPRVAAATWKVEKYDLNVTLPQDTSRSVSLRAVLNLKNVSGRPASSLTLRISPTAELSAVKVNDSAAEFTKNEEKINAGTSLQRIAIRLPSIAADAAITASVEYKIALKDNSAVASVTASGTQFLPQSFWYPTPNSWFYARGTDLAPVTIKVTPSPGHRVVTSGRPAAGGFEQSIRAQPFFLTGNFTAIESSVPGVTVLAATLDPTMMKQAADLAKFYSEARDFVATLLGKAPDVPLTIVASRRGAGFGSSGTVVVDEAVFRRTKLDSQTVMNIAEAAAKVWLGSAIAVDGEGYGIITEGLTRYIATQFIERKFGKDVADIERARHRNAYAAIARRDSPMSTVSPPDDYFYTEVANKGAMVWRILATRVGPTQFAEILKAAVQDGSVTVPEIRGLFAQHKPLVDYLFDQVTDMNLRVGLPVGAGAETRVQLRNTGAVEVTVDVVATTASGERIVASVTIAATSYGEAVFKTPNKVLRVEIDAEKLYPQIDYSDDVKPQETSDSDPLLAAKRLFDKQEFAKAEALARKLLRDLPRLDDLRVLLARSLLAQNKNSEAENEFRAVLDEKLPSSRSLAWASLGLAEIASRTNQNDAAIKFIEAAILSEGDFGASLAARNLRNRLTRTTVIDADVKTFFASFDEAASANRKAAVDALVVPGEVARFAGGVAGSTEQWKTNVRQVDRLDANTILVEAEMTIKLLNKPIETGMAVYRLSRSSSGWKLSAVEMFEVR